MGSLAFIPVGERTLDMDVEALANRLVRLDILEPSRVLACMVSQSSLFEPIKAHQYDDPHLFVLKDMAPHGDTKEVTIGDDRVLRLRDRICAPNMDGLRELILDEAHKSLYSIHTDVMKIYCDLKQHYWWRIMNKGTIGHVAWIFNCQQAKYEHHKLVSLLQNMDIPEWK
ncbi:uncharacterized protein [Nicotiana sylvestris]|uniref:uncharacterized protein n=1 Tax=Nicotiana sylvestris TaxID=4096 RepID=UPI00388C9987